MSHPFSPANDNVRKIVGKTIFVIMDEDQPDSRRSDGPILVKAIVFGDSGDSQGALRIMAERWIGPSESCAVRQLPSLTYGRKGRENYASTQTATGFVL